MGSRYLLDLADVCRRTGYNVIEVEGWQYRARGSGGYNDWQTRPCLLHHTGFPAVVGRLAGHELLHVQRRRRPTRATCTCQRVPEIYVCAAGATNTNGTGDCPHLSPDTMNSSAIGIEAGNHGGHPWPEVQQDAYLELVSVLCDAYDIPAAHVESHAEWAPSRKVDPAGESSWAPGTGTWDMDDFRADLGTTDPGGDFLMALTDQQQQELYDRIMGTPARPVHRRATRPRRRRRRCTADSRWTTRTATTL